MVLRNSPDAVRLRRKAERLKGRFAICSMETGRVYRAIYEIDESHNSVYVLTIRHGAMKEARPDELS